MITASMTSGEMRRVRNLDETRIYEFQMRKANELKREMRKQNVRQITKTFEFRKGLYSQTLHMKFQGIPIMQSPLLLVKIPIDFAYLSTLETGINRKHLI